MKIIAKRFSSSSAGVLLEKVIRKNYKMFRHETSMRKLFFSKVTCSLTEKEFCHILFPWKFRKMSRKKPRNFQKNYWHGLFRRIFLQIHFKNWQNLLADPFQNNIFQNALSRCIMSNSLEDIFHSVHVWYDEAILV